MAAESTNWLLRRLDPVELLLRFVVAAVFIDSAWSKLRSPLNFSDTIRNYRILEDPWIAWLAMGLPPFLLVVGMCIALRILYPACVICAAVALAGFVAALASLVARGIDVECGCLSFKVPISVQILIDVLLITVCAALLWMDRRTRRRTGAAVTC